MDPLSLVGIGQITPLFEPAKTAKVQFLLNREPDEHELRAAESTKLPLIEGLDDVEMNVSVGNLGAMADGVSATLGAINEAARQSRITAQATRDAMVLEAQGLDFPS
jgi:hypothetical protein